MAQLPTLLCCPTPAINPGMPRPIPVTPVDPCVDAQKVFICGGELTPQPPAVPVTLDGQDCDGAALPATGNPGELVQIVQAPGQVLSVRFCSDDNSDFELSCGIDPATDHQIQTAYKIVNGAFELIKRWDTVTGAEWTGDPATLKGCGGSSLEAEKEEFCDGTNSFFRWYVIEDGAPTGDFVDTDYDGASYTPLGPVTRGSCVAACNPTISSAFGDDLSALLPGNSIAIQKPSCCAIKVTTSAGDFLVRKGMVAYSTTDFNCPVTVTAVEVVDGTCEVSEVIVTTQAKG